DRDSHRAAELAAYLLSQLPRDVKAILPPTLVRGRTFEWTARAYGLASRIQAVPDPRKEDGDLLLNDAQSISPAELLVSITPWADAGSGPDVADVDDGLLAGHRVAIVTNIAIHYRRALFERVEERLDRLGAAFCVFLLAESPRDRPWLERTE